MSELLEKSFQQIQHDTAKRWAGRACAAARIASERPSLVPWTGDAREYAHEAIEHAALAGDELVREVRAGIEAGSFPSREAEAEIVAKGLRGIELDTAMLWAARARDAYMLAAARPEERAAWLSDASEYEHEAIEHAALVDDDRFLAGVRATIAMAKPDGDAP